MPSENISQRIGAKTLLPAGIFFLALLCVYLVLLKFTFDGPGDGPSRALEAYLWSLKPELIASSHYPPGYVYINGFMSFLIRDPLFTVRVMNCFWSASSVGIFFLLVQRVFNLATAYLSSVLLAFMPLLIGLGISSLSEPCAMFFIFASMLFLIMCADSLLAGKKSALTFLLLSALSLTIANSVRCEGWTYIPLWIVYFWYRTRRIDLSLGFLSLLLLFPLYWIYSCWQDASYPLVSFGGPTDFRNKAISIGQAIVAFLGYAFSYLGPLVPLSALAGLFVVLAELKRRNSQEWTERAFYGLFFLQCSLIAFTTVVKYGDNVERRFFLISFSLCLALASYVFVLLIQKKLHDKPIKKHIVSFAIAGLALLDSMLLSFNFIKPYIYVVNQRPDELIATAQWLKKNGHSDDYILSTGLNYRAYFIPLLLPAIAEHTRIVIQWWTPLLELADDLEAHPPSLLIVGSDDGADLDIIQSVVKFRTTPDPVFQNSYVSVYGILPGTMQKVESPHLPPCFWYPQPNILTFFQPVKIKKANFRQGER